jgi:CRISPR/Cas system-associated exonuclease Cas4 (RecB family)
MSFVTPKIVAWSYSRLSSWEECPAKAKYKFLLKLPEPASPYAARGTDLHSLAEDYIKGKIIDVPTQLSNVQEYLDELKHADTKTELQLAFTEAWEPTEWFAMNVYCRVIFDAVRVLPEKTVVVDHKTGKKRQDEHTDQLRLYALATFKQWPETPVVDAQVIYIDQAERLRMTFTKDKIPELQAYWDERAGKMRADDMFSPRPNPNCKWCHYRKSNGGPCQFS